MEGGHSCPASQWVVKRCGLRLSTFASHWHVGEATALLEGGSMDKANILKPALARGAIRLIGATTCNVIL